MFLRPVLCLALATALSLASCSSLPRPAQAEEPFAFAGGVVRAPASGSWQVYQHEENVVLFLRGTEHAEHRISATAGVVARPFADLQRYRDYLDQPSAPGGHRCVAREFEVVEDEGRPGFVRGALAFERGPIDAPASRTDNRSRGYLLGDGRQVILSVTQTYPPSMEPLDLTEELRPFFEGFALAGSPPEATRREDPKPVVLAPLGAR